MSHNIELFPHNEEAYIKLCKGLEEYPLAFLEHATGTGKSFILLKFLYVKCLLRNVLFISMHEEMFGQLFDDQMKTLGISKEEFTCFDTMIYPNILRHVMEELIRKYDVFVFDEAHHCGAEKWSVQVEELKKLVLATPGKIMVGATATGIRYLDGYTDVSEVYFDGHTVSRLPISTSILKNLLPAPIYINSLTSCLDKFLRVANKFKKVPLNKETKALKMRMENLDEKLKCESAVATVLQKYGVKKGEKYIVFCKDIADVKSKMEEAKEWFKDIGPVKMFQAHSAQKRQKNISEIKEFSEKREEVSLMFAVDIFNEGFHIDGVDGVFMFRKTKSPIIYFQQIGRALSFSVRRKQIKIFDFVDNISENDVIYELYKELIKEARRLAIEDPEHREFYEEIVSRFQIIDETTKIMDELNEIEKIIDDNYIARNTMENAIAKLVEYREFYPNTDFKAELKLNRIGADYVRAYNYICRMSDDLTIDQIERLKLLNISYNRDINIPIEERKKLLGSCQSIKELREKQYMEFVNQYIEFYNKNGRRPDISNDTYEYNLYMTYRYYLRELSAKKLNRLITRFPFPASVEEVILTGNYPDKDKVNEYVAMIKKKIESGIDLDNVEIKVMRRIVHAISLGDNTLIDAIEKYDDINEKIEKAIKVIAQYKRDVDSSERFANINLLVGEKDVYKAIKIIHKHAYRITTPQFEKLLELDIELPKSINMTLEQRKRLLGKYNSFYEKEKNENANILDRYIAFVKKMGRRPSIEVADEKELYIAYHNHLVKASTVKIREICTALTYYGIPLSFYERIIGGEIVDISVVREYVLGVMTCIRNIGAFGDEDLRLMRAIKRQKYDIDNIDLIIEEMTNIGEINRLIAALESNINKGISNSQLENIRIIRIIANKSKFLTRKHLEKLQSLHVEMSSLLVEEINGLGEYLNIYERDVKLSDSFVLELSEYVKSTGTRPIQGSSLDLKYRFHVAGLAKQKLQSFVSIFRTCDKPVTFEEQILLELGYSEEDLRKYIADIDRKNSLKLPLDKLECRVLNKLHTRRLISSSFNKKVNKASNTVPEKSLEDRVVDSLYDAINRNPTQPINFNNTLYNISAVNRRKLEQYRMRLLSKKFFREVLNVIKKDKKPLIECLTIKQYNDYLEFVKLPNLDEETKFLVAQINSLDIEYRFLSKGLQYQQFIANYIGFIRNHEGMRPNIASEDALERSMASEFDEVQLFISKADLLKIDQAIRDSRAIADPVDFYQKFYTFIIDNGRFPCGNSDDNYEVMLNNMYVSMSSKLTKEQLTELKKLKKVYSKATVKANIEFSKKHKLGFNKN